MKRTYYYKKYPKKTFRSGTIARSKKGAWASKRSDKTETFSCTINGNATATLAGRTQLTNTLIFHPYNGGLTTEGAVNDQRNLVHGGAVNDRLFRLKCSTYDEVKLDTMRVTLTPTQIGVNNNLTFTLCTMWDRKATPMECGYIPTAQQQFMEGGAIPTALEIFNNEGTIKSAMTQTTIYGFKRYCQASSILEKGGYTSADILYNETPDTSPLLYLYLDAWLKQPLNFSPALYACIYSPAAIATNISISLSYKIEYTFTFRNPKSEIAHFCTVEAPGYENPDEPDPPGRQLSSLQKHLLEIYTLTGTRDMPITEIKKSLKPLFVETEKEEMNDDEDEEEQEEDQPPTKKTNK